MNDALQRMLEDHSIEAQAFDARHPMFRIALSRLQVTVEAAFLREKQVRTDIVWGLARLAVEDFEHLLLLSIGGYGYGALKMLRPLYERVVTALYLIKHTNEMLAFNDYVDIDALRCLNQMFENCPDIRDKASQQLAEIKDASDQVKPRFKEMKCPECKRGSWTNKDLKTMATEVGLERDYGLGSSFPTALLHSTRLGVDVRLEQIPAGATRFNAEPHRELADQGLKCAHDLMVVLLNKCNEYFDWKLDMAIVLTDLEDCWGNDQNACSPNFSERLK